MDNNRNMIEDKGYVLLGIAFSVFLIAIAVLPYILGYLTYLIATLEGII